MASLVLIPFLCLSGPQSPDSEEQQQRLGYDFAQQELMEKELGNDPIQEAIGAIEKQHEEDKQGQCLVVRNCWA